MYDSALTVLLEYFIRPLKIKTFILKVLNLTSSKKLMGTDSTRFTVYEFHTLGSQIMAIKYNKLESEP